VIFTGAAGPGRRDPLPDQPPTPTPPWVE
jgi:hypothetical protein